MNFSTVHTPWLHVRLQMLQIRLNGSSSFAEKEEMCPPASSAIKLLGKCKHETLPIRVAVNRFVWFCGKLEQGIFCILAWRIPILQFILSVHELNGHLGTYWDYRFQDKKEKKTNGTRQRDVKRRQVSQQLFEHLEFCAAICERCITVDWCGR